MNVAFITNGSNDIGFGHISRTSLLSSFFLSKGNKVKIFYPRSCLFELDEDAIRVDSFCKEDLMPFLFSYDVVVIDSIKADYDKLIWLREEKVFIVTITLFLFDIKNRFEHLSFYPSTDDPGYSLIDRLNLYKGRDYLTFRSEFSEIDFVVKDKAKNIIITMGGTDPMGLTLKVLKSIAHNPALSLTVLLSEVSADFDNVQHYTRLSPNVKLLKFTNNIADLFSKHDVAIINGGLTRYEACVIGIPFLALSIHTEQFIITQKLVDKGVGVNIGVYNEVSEQYIYEQVMGLLNDYERRSTISYKMKSLFDSYGVERIYNIIKESFYSYEKDDKKS